MRPAWSLCVSSKHCGQECPRAKYRANRQKVRRLSERNRRRINSSREIWRKAQRWPRQRFGLLWLPQVNGPFGVGVEWQMDSLAGCGRCIRRKDRLQYRLAVFPGAEWLAVIPDAAYEMCHLLRKAVIPRFLIDRE